MPVADSLAIKSCGLVGCNDQVQTARRSASGYFFSVMGGMI
jgi:hypothetical protein